jgi:predicted DsbA family dithiol-disulfide isomerase
MEPLRLIVYSDYLCPWCYLGTVRLRRIGEEFGERVQFEWRSFLLRPQPDPRRTLEKFRAYTQSWQRVAAEPDAPAFCVWQSDAGPPTHSIPPHLAAKAAAAIGPEAFHRMHDRDPGCSVG